MDAVEIERRKSAYHRPYHAAIRAALSEITDTGQTPVLVSMHSFTPQFKNRPVRPWHVGLLWDSDDRLVVPLMRRMRSETDWVVGDNEPYTGQLEGDCMWQHGTRRRFPHALIEIRNDLVETPGSAGRVGRAPRADDPQFGRRDEWCLRPPRSAPYPDQNFYRRAAMPELNVTEIEAAVFRRLRDHLRNRTDVQNIDMMNLSGFCRNCLSRWYQEAAAEQGVEIEKDAGARNGLRNALQRLARQVPDRSNRRPESCVQGQPSGSLSGRRPRVDEKFQRCILRLVQIGGIAVDQEQRHCAFDDHAKLTC